MNEETVTLLREIRDLQKSQVENQQVALDQQRGAIDLQQKASRLQRLALLVLIISAVFVFIVLAYPSLTRH